MKKTNKKATGERLEFNYYSNVTVEHLHRYAIAKDFVLGKTVLDIASGEGYGSYLLSETASKVIGVDIDFETIKNAKKKYLKSNLKYLVGNADKIPVESNSFDVVVSFETIEHHDKHDEMLLEIKRVLKHDGVLIMSSPDKKYYSDLTGQKNPFHVKELYFKDFKELINKYFDYTNYYCQSSFNLNSFITCSEKFSNHTVYLGNETYLNKDRCNPVYNLVIASDLGRFSTGDSFFDGTEIRNKIIERIKSNLVYQLNNSIVKEIKSTYTFKLGSIIIYPLFKFKKYIKRIFEPYVK